MSFQWNATRPGPGRQVGDRNQPMAQWPNQDQYNLGNIQANQFAYQETGATSNDWNAGVNYNQWCPSASQQQQMNWGCTNYPPSNQYNQVMQNTFAPNVYPTYNQSKPNYPGNSGFDYQQTSNSFIPGQGNGNYRMQQSNYLTNCQGSSKVFENPNANSNYSYWDAGGNGGDNVNYMSHSMYNNSMCENMPVSNMAMKGNDLDPNPPPQTEMIQTYNNKKPMIQQKHIMKPDVGNSRFSSSSQSDYFMGVSGVLPPENSHSSNVSPSVHDNGKNQNFQAMFNPLNQSQDYDSLLETKTNNQDDNFKFGNNSKARFEYSMPSKRENNIDGDVLLQTRIIDLQRRVVEKTTEFTSKKSSTHNFERSYEEIFHLNTEVKALDSELQNIESEVRMKFMTHKMPSSSINKPKGHGFHSENEYAISDSGANDYGLSAESMSVKSLRQHINTLKEHLSQQLVKPDRPPDHRNEKKKLRDQKKMLPGPGKAMRQVRKAVLSYLVKLSSQVEKCFKELRNVKQMLKDDPNDKQVGKILRKVGMSINQATLSLQEKKKFCEKNKIKLKSLTIKATGVNILRTLEGDMHHLKKFYTTAKHIAGHSGMLEKVPEGDEGSAPGDEKRPPPSFDFDSDDDAFDIEDGDVNNLSASSQASNVCLGLGSTPTTSYASCKKGPSPKGPPQKKVKTGVSEINYWDRLMKLSYLIRSKILNLRQAERAYKNGQEGSLETLRSLYDYPPTDLQQQLKFLTFRKSKSKFCRHVPPYILERYPEGERRSRDKITLKSVRKNLQTFTNLCLSVRVMIASGPLGEGELTTAWNETNYWKNIFVLNQKISMYHPELLKLQLALKANRQDKKNLESLVRIEERIKELQSDLEKEEKIKQRNNISDDMPAKVETLQFKLNGEELKNVNVVRESFGSLKALLSDIKSSISDVSPKPNQLLPSSGSTSATPGSMPLQTHPVKKEQVLSSDLSHFLGDGPSRWI